MLLMLKVLKAAYFNFFFFLQTKTIRVSLHKAFLKKKCRQAKMLEEQLLHWQDICILLVGQCLCKETLLQIFRKSLQKTNSFKKNWSDLDKKKQHSSICLFYVISVVTLWLTSLILNSCFHYHITLKVFYLQTHSYLSI